MLGDNVFIADCPGSENTTGKKIITELEPNANAIQTPTVITPMAPQSSSCHESASNLNKDFFPTPAKDVEVERTLKALEQARLDAERTAEALEYLVCGIRGVKRILERGTSNEETDKEALNNDINMVHELSGKLHGTLGADLLALVNAADMIREHSKLAAQETSDLVNDIYDAKLQAQKSEFLAKQTRKLGRKLYKENLNLKSEVDMLRQQKRLLVKEVKLLREEAAETRKFDSWRLLEQHVLGSMAIHEMMIKSPATPKYGHNKITSSVSEQKPCRGKSALFQDTLFTPKRDNGRDRVPASAEEMGAHGNGISRGFPNIRGAFRSRKSVESCEKNRNMKGREEQGDENENIQSCDLGALYSESEQLSQSGVGKQLAKSPIPSLGAASSCTEDDVTKTPNHDEVTSEDVDPMDEKHLPTNVAFDAVSRAWSSPYRLPSTLMFSRGSPDGVIVPAYKPMCDPNILRTLAIPSNDHMQTYVGQTETTHPTLREDGLHEC